jgi:NAD(P)H-hydrate epimerase
MATELNKAEIRALLAPRAEDAHKGDFGHVFIVAGARGYAGAAKLAARAAERSGAGLVTLGVPAPLLDTIAAALTETMTLALEADKQGGLAAEAATAALDFAQGKSAAGVGPGLGRGDGASQFVETFAVRCPVPFVLDADGLNALSGRADLLALKQSDCILTPHPGEMARLLQCSADEVQADRETAALRLAEKAQAVVALKGARTLIAAPGGPIFENPTGNHGLAKGGSGDVLTGLIAGLVAQGLTPLNAAKVGVFTHGLAADLAAEAIGARGMIASDVIDHLPAAWRAIEAR